MTWSTDPEIRLFLSVVYLSICATFLPVLSFESRARPTNAPHTAIPLPAPNIRVCRVCRGEPSSSNRKCYGQEWTCQKWPQVSCNYGSFDFAGFVKPAAWHYRAWWLAAIPPSDPSRSPIPCEDVVKIVHDWRNPAPPIVAVYSNLPVVELFLNGESLGKQPMGWANWSSWVVPFVPGNLIAVAYRGTGASLSPAATDTKLTPGAPAAIVLSLDAPSIATGTGSTLVLDGQDAALVRASIVDSAGRTTTGCAAVNVTFTVVNGPGRVIGVGNGDPSSHDPNKVSWRLSYHGLVRAVVQTTIDATTPRRDLLRVIDLESEMHIPAMYESTAVEHAKASGIVVEATAPGFEPSRITIPVSDDPSTEGVVAVARGSFRSAIDIS